MCGGVPWLLGLLGQCVPLGSAVADFFHSSSESPLDHEQEAVLKATAVQSPLWCP